MNHKVSIIIPSYNHAKFLPERINSIQNQTYTNFEIIILDDCSTDASQSIIKSYAKHPKVTHVIFNTTNNLSPFKQWLKGFELATGDLIWIAESDDVSEESFLETLIPYFNEERVGICFCNSKLIDSESNVLENQKKWYNDISSEKLNFEFIDIGVNFIEDYQQYKNFILNASSVIFRKHLIDDSIKQIAEFKYCGDWLFWNILIAKTSIAYNNKTLNKWRIHDKSSTTFVNMAIDLNRLKENRRVISLTHKQICKKYIKANYQWILSWWIGRFSYRNLLFFRYIYPPVPNFLILDWFQLLVKRIIMELYSSLIRKIKMNL